MATSTSQNPKPGEQWVRDGMWRLLDAAQGKCQYKQCLQGKSISTGGDELKPKLQKHELKTCKRIWDLGEWTITINWVWKVISSKSSSFTHSLMMFSFIWNDLASVLRALCDRTLHHPAVSVLHLWQTQTKPIYAGSHGQWERSDQKMLQL